MNFGIWNLAFVLSLYYLRANSGNFVKHPGSKIKKTFLFLGILAHFRHFDCGSAAL
jgi:hypothetical protein